MKRSVRRFSAVFAAGCFLLLTALPAVAGTLKYPKAKPVMILDVPEGWTAEEEDDTTHPLNITTKDDSMKFQVNLLCVGKFGLTDTKADIKKLAKLTAENAKLSDLKIGDPVEDKSKSGLPATALIVTGTNKGAKVTYIIALFKMKGQCYEFILTSLNTDDSDKSDTQFADSILDSIEPLK